jgi:Vam6/Vps39-like protein vacuolar protein sorting-associated protein 39
VETLVRYITDPRPKLTPALAAVHITPENQSDVFSPLSEVPVEELFALPNLPLSNLTPEQLLRYAQLVDTALYKSFLIIRPGLLGPLCRTANWCEVSEVEEDLYARQVFIDIVRVNQRKSLLALFQKFAELIDLYRGKKMHAKALNLLQE